MSNTTRLLLVFAGLLAAAVACGDEGTHSRDEAAAGETQVQTTCPVMGGKIDPNMYTDYKGKRVYFCCASCEKAFEKDPARYLHSLPQFASLGGLEEHEHEGEGEHEREGEHEHDHIGLAAFIVPMGITTLSLVALTVCLSLFRRISPRAMLKWHKVSGILALISGAIHGSLVLFLG